MCRVGKGRGTRPCPPCAPVGTRVPLCPPYELLPRRGERLLGLRPLHLGERLAVLDRHHLAEFRQELFPAVEDLAGAARIGVVSVPLDEGAETLAVEARHVLHDVDEAM